MHAIQSWWNPDTLLQSPPYSTISHRSTSTCSRPLSPQRQDVGTILSWWKPENLLQNRPHNRPQSTYAQESSSGDSRASAILHGAKSPSRSHPQSNYNGSGRFKRAEESRSAPPRTAQIVGKYDPRHAHKKGLKQNIGAQYSPQAQRSRKNSVVLKDEAYIRRTMHVPTEADYPALKARIFQNPKSTIHDHIGHGILKRNFKALGSDGVRCTISCDSLGIGVVEGMGEGTKKVSRSDSF